jgi:hypothetical protein
VVRHIDLVPGVLHIVLEARHSRAVGEELQTGQEEERRSPAVAGALHIVLEEARRNLAVEGGRHTGQEEEHRSPAVVGVLHIDPEVVRHTGSAAAHHRSLVVVVGHIPVAGSHAAHCIADSALVVDVDLAEEAVDIAEVVRILAGLLEDISIRSVSAPSAATSTKDA